MESAQTVTASLAERVYSDIVDGHFAPGARLKLNGLALRYDAGLIPLREALSRLAHRGFVIPVSQKGFRVAPVSRDDLLDLTRTRTEIECIALARSVADGGVDWEMGILASAHRLRRTKVYADDNKLRVTPDWEDAHIAFHDALTAGCDSPRIAEFRRSMADQARRYRKLSVAYSASPRQVEAEHDAIAEAALDRDADALCRLITEHYGQTARILLETTVWEDL